MPRPWVAFRAALTRFDRSKIVTEIAIRNSVGFATALLIGTLVRSPSAGVIAATGALNVSYSDSRDPYRTRGQRMLISAALCAVAVAAGGISGHSNATAITAATLWAFASGMLVALGAQAGDLGVITLVTLVVYAARPLPTAEAIQAGLTAFAGAAIQILLSIAPWPIRRYEPERRIVAELYRSLGQMARSPVPPSLAPPFSTQISDAQDSLASLGSDHGMEAERLLTMLSQAERIRLSILALARLGHRIARYEQGKQVSTAVQTVLQSAAAVLDAIAGEASQTPPLAPFPRKWAAHSTFFAALVRDAAQQIDALGGQLRTASGAAVPDPVVSDAREPWKLRFGGRIAKLQANLSFQSTVFRHALRLALCLGIGDTLGRELSLERTYWIPMTIAIVLKPDFTTTLSRGVLRIIGTFAGLGVATVLFHYLHTGTVTDIALAAVFLFFLRWIGPAHYGIFVTALSALVVLLAALTGISPKDVISARAVNTIVGGLLAMIAYAVWPTWEKTQVRPVLAEMLDAYRDYFGAVVASLGEKNPRRIDKVRLRGRRARSNAEASVDRRAGEPGVSAETMLHVNAIMVSSHSFVHAAMTIESAVYRTEPVPARPNTLDFAEQVELTLQAAAVSLRTGRPLPKDLPNLRAAQLRIAGSEARPAQRYELVNVETDRIATSVNTLTEHVEALL